jgi:hypothetical protein
MRDYGIVHTTFWTSDDTGGLSDTARMLALYLMVGPHTNQIGCFRLPDGYVTDDLKWGYERVSEGFRELSEKGFATRDEVSKWVVIHKYLKWNEIENPNQGKSAARLFEQVPDKSPVKALLVKALREYAPRFPVTVLDAFERVSKGLGKPFRNQEQEQEQEQEDSAPTGADAVASPSAEEIAKRTKTELWRAGKSLLREAGMPEAQCGTFVGRLCKDYGDEIVIDAVRAAVVQRPADPATWLVGACKERKAQAGGKGGGAWWATPERKLAKAIEVGVGEARPGESDDAWKARIQAAIDNGGKPPQPKQQPAVTVRDPGAAHVGKTAMPEEQRQQLLAAAGVRQPTATADASAT